MQWKPARNAKFAKDEAKIGLAKLKKKVTGGLDGDNFLSSTEIFTLDSDRWVSAASLPSPREYFSGATLGNSVFVFGGSDEISDHYYDDIFEYNPVDDAWRQVGKLKTLRFGHSVVPVDDISQLCH